MYVDILWLDIVLLVESTKLYLHLGNQDVREIWEEFEDCKSNIANCDIDYISVRNSYKLLECEVWEKHLNSEGVKKIVASCRTREPSKRDQEIHSSGKPFS